MRHSYISNMNQSPAVSTALEGYENVNQMPHLIQPKKIEVILKDVYDLLTKSLDLPEVLMVNEKFVKGTLAMFQDICSYSNSLSHLVLCLLSEESGIIWDAMFHTQDEPAGSINKMRARRLLSSMKKHAHYLHKSIDLPSVLSFSFGTENCVNIRRELVTLREKLKMTELDESLSLNQCDLSSGSLSEGLAYPESDDDIMLFDKEYKVLDSDTNVANDSNSLMIVYSQDFHGYCSILDKNGSMPDGFITIINGQRFVSSSLFKETKKRKCNMIRLIDHGPALSFCNGIVETDLVTCYECPFWPKVAREWISRDRSYGWPSPEQIKIIVESGCHVVPVGDPRSQHCAHEWRISFSLAERILVHSFNHSQFLTYSVLRNALKKIIDKRFPDVLCSYFVKTVMLHTIERTHRTMWRMDNLDICYIVCLSVLYLFIDYKDCPNYFIPKYNMMRRKINQTNRQPLLNLIIYLIQIRILGFDVMRYIDGPKFRRIEFNHDQEFFNSYLLKDISFCFRDFIWDFFDSKSYMPETSKLMSFREFNSKNVFIQRILNNARNYLSQALMGILWRKENRNKLRYNKHKCLGQYIRNLQEGDLTTNKLTKATYLYLVCKIEICISIIKKFVASFPPHAILTTSTNSRAYMNDICSRGYTLEEKAKLAWYPHFSLNSNDLYAFPSHLSIWLETLDTLNFHPLTYAYLLESLCYIEIKNTKAFIKSTDDIMKHLTYLTDNRDVLYAQMCMAIIRFAQGDNNNSYQWFKVVYKTLELLSKICEDGDGDSHGTWEIPRQYWNNLVKKSRRVVLLYVACLISREISDNSNVKDNFALPLVFPLD